MFKCRFLLTQKEKSKNTSTGNMAKPKDLELLRISICIYYTKQEHKINPEKGQGWT